MKAVYRMAVGVVEYVVDRLARRLVTDVDRDHAKTSSSISDRTPCREERLSVRVALKPHYWIARSTRRPSRSTDFGSRRRCFLSADDPSQNAVLTPGT